MHIPNSLVLPRFMLHVFAFGSASKLEQLPADVTVDDVVGFVNGICGGSFFFVSTNSFILSFNLNMKYGRF